ncbi:MAG: Lrp/AsnC family transcriptional regulator [Candidatus Thorarchaeota archaeon]|nr:Lrp/AsnC family transcriptional regulator [Candidatus Thorarchaeota archaeon]
MLRDWAVLISGTWSKIDAKISGEFGLDSVPCPVEMRATSETRPGYFGGWIEQATLFLTNECLRGDIPHIGVLAREYMRTALEKQDFEKTILEDFSLAYGAFWVPSKKLNNWYSEWNSYRPHKGDEFTGIFHPTAAFQLFQTFSGSDYYGKLLTEYLLMKKMGLVLSEQEYILHMLERMRKFSVKLNTTDFSLIRRLLEDPQASRSELAKETNTSVYWVSRRLASLQEHEILEKQREIFYPCLGMKQSLVLLQCPEQSDPYDYVIDSPFLHSASRVISGTYDLVAHFLVPDNYESAKHLRTFQTILSNRQVQSEIYDIESIGSDYCFDHYSTTKHRWELPWELFGPHLKRIYDESLGDLIVPSTKQCTKTTKKLDELDLRILSEYQCGHSMRELRKKLGVKYEKLVGRLNELKAEGLVEEKYNLHHIGLNETLMLNIPSFEYGESIAAWAQRLPFTKFLLGPDGEMNLILHLPDGGLQGMALTLQTLLKSIKPMLLDSHELVGTWYAPQNSWFEHVAGLWDVKKQTWKSPEEDILNWFGSIPEG